MKAFKYRLYPTTAQAQMLEWQLSRCCELYNTALQERKDAWNACKEHPNFYDPEWRKEHARDYSVSFVQQCRSLTEVRNEIRPEYQQIGSHVPQNVLHRVDKAFQAFFRRVKNGQAPGYPRYQSRTRYDSFCFPDHAGWKLTGNRLSITTIGMIKVKRHREVQGTIKTCTIKREGEQWYVVVAASVEAQPRLPYTDLAVGSDRACCTSLPSLAQTPSRIRAICVGRKRSSRASKPLSRVRSVAAIDARRRRGRLGSATVRYETNGKTSCTKSRASWWSAMRRSSLRICAQRT